MATIGAVNRVAPMLPANGASPNANTPPSAAASQYPSPVGVDAMATIGAVNRVAPMLPANGASPNANTPPSAAASQYPPPADPPVADTTPHSERLPASPVFLVAVSAPTPADVE